MKKIKQILAVAIPVIFVLLALFRLGLFSSWNTKLTDKLFTQRPPNPNISIVAIDEKSLAQIGRWPWDRSAHANLIEKIEKDSPKAIGLDISFFEESEDDKILENTLAKYANIVLAAESVNSKIITPLPIFAEQARAAVVNTDPDADSITREVKTSFGNYKQFAVELSEKETKDQSVKINFSGPPGNYPYYSYVDVLEGKIPDGFFKDKIVLVGATAPDLHDTQMVPTSNGNPMPGIEIHANTVATLLENRFLTHEPNLHTILFLSMAAVATAGLFTLTGIIPAALLSLILIPSFIAFTAISFNLGTIRNLIYPPLGIILTSISSVIYKYLTEYKQKIFIKNAFSKYLSRDVLSEILKDPKKLALGGEKRQITVLFSDIKGFTTISEKLPPEILSKLLNEYLGAMTTIVFEFGGVLDKYIGDAVMAFWGAPIATSDHAQQAVRAAIAMQKKITELIPVWKKADINDFGVRIGIATGEASVGNFGSNIRFNYTAVGDTVNLASRLEGINKIYGTNIIISEETYKKLSGEIPARKLDLVAVKGKKQGVYIYEVFPTGRHPVGAEFETARQFYEEGKFSKALDILSKLSKKYPMDRVLSLYIERCKLFTNEKPKNWDGIYRAETK